MKRWKITGPKQEPVTCENCEEGREIVCVYRRCRGKKIRHRRGVRLYSHENLSTGDAHEYTFIRYLDPDPEPPKQVRFADVANGVVFRAVNGEYIWWKVDDYVMWYDEEYGLCNGESLADWSANEPVTLTGQVAELVEEE